MPANVGIEFTRAQVEPMVRGQFRRDEQDLVLATLEKSVVYVTTETIESILWNERWERLAWDLANMYLLSVGAKLSGKKAARIVGMSEETTCYVAADYFTENELSPGRLLAMEGGLAHSVEALEDSALLVTLGQRERE